MPQRENVHEHIFNATILDFGLGVGVFFATKTTTQILVVMALLMALYQSFSRCGSALGTLLRDMKCTMPKIWANIWRDTSSEKSMIQSCTKCPSSLFTGRSSVYTQHSSVNQSRRS